MYKKNKNILSTILSHELESGEALCEKDNC